MFEFSDEYIAKLLQGIYDGSITVYNLDDDVPQSLYYAIANYLKKGLYEGFGASLQDLSPDHTDYDLLSELRENIYMFSGAKTYQQVREMTDLLMDGDSVRSWSDFKAAAMDVYDQYNTDWLKSEYNTAIGQADMAAKWSNIEAQKDVLPMLTFSTNGVPCEECAPMEGISAPVDDPIWDEYTPLIHFNCQCILLQGDEEVNASSDSEIEDAKTAMNETMQPEFRMNPYKDKVVFNEDQGYFNVPKEDTDLAANNFNLPIPDSDGK